MLSPSMLVQPRVCLVPENVGTAFTPEHNRLLVSWGVGLDFWQQQDLARIMAVDASGNWAASEAGELVARQNGKGEILLALDLLHLFVVRRKDNKAKTVVHTSHEVKTNTEALAKLEAVVRSNPQLMARVSQIYTGHTGQGIRLKPRPGQRRGDRIMFIARSKNSGRGFTADVIIYDEAQELSQASYRALSYTATTVKNRQEVFTGTVPEEGVNDAEVWEALRDRGRAEPGSFKRTCWIEYSPKGSDDPKKAKRVDLADESNWEAANPSIDIRVFRETTAGELERDTSPDKEGFARERLSIWPARPEAEVAKLSDLDLTKWKEQADATASVAGEGVVLALALGRTGAYGTIGKARRVDDTHIAVEHHRTDSGTRWIAEELRQVKADNGNALVVLDPKNAAVVMSSLEKAGIKFLAMNLDEIAAAQATFVEYSNAGLIPHRPQDEATRSFEFATTRPIGRAGVTWEQSDPAKPVSIAQALTWAHWGVLKSEASPKRELPPPPEAAVLTTTADSPLGGYDIGTIRF